MSNGCSAAFCFDFHVKHRPSSAALLATLAGGAERTLSQLVSAQHGALPGRPGSAGQQAGGGPFPLRRLPRRDVQLEERLGDQPGFRLFGCGGSGAQKCANEWHLCASPAASHCGEFHVGKQSVHRGYCAPGELQPGRPRGFLCAAKRGGVR